MFFIFIFLPSAAADFVGQNSMRLVPRQQGQGGQQESGLEWQGMESIRISPTRPRLPTTLVRHQPGVMVTAFCCGVLDYISIFCN